MLNSLNVSDNDTKNLTVLSRQNVLDKDFTVYGSVENPLFLAKDVAEWIDYSWDNKEKGIRKVSQLVSLVDENEKVFARYNIATTSDINNVSTTSRKTQDTWFLTEDGLYEILMLSRKPIAKQFKKEVKKILHQLRTKGGYITEKGMSALLDNPEYLMELVSESSKKLLEIKRENAIMKPKADFYDQVTGSADALEMKEVAKVLNIKGLGRTNLFEFLRSNEILDKNNVPYQKFIDAGFFRVIESKWVDNMGETHINLKTVVYQKGVDYIRKAIFSSPEYLNKAIDGAADSFIEKGEHEYQKVINRTATRWINTNLNPNPKSSCIFKSE